MPEKGLNILRHVRVVMFFAIGFYYLTNSPKLSVLNKEVLIFGTLVLTVNHFLLFRVQKEHKLFYLFFVDFIIATTIGLLFYTQGNFFIVYYNIIGVTVYLKTSNQLITRSFIALFILICAGSLIRTGLIFGDWDVFGYLLNAAFVLFGCLVGYLIRELMLAREQVAEQYDKLNVSHQSLQEAHEQLRVYAQQVEELTSIQERNRIAREIHDTVGHKMTALLIQLQLAKELIIQQKDNRAQTIETCENIARDALREIRRSVQTLRPHEHESVNFQALLKKLLEEFSNLAQIETALDIEGDLSKIPTSIQPTLKRIIQEALTNAVRHGNATNCIISIKCSEDKIICHIRDNGKGDSKINPGFGLVNMRERISQHGGRLRVESEPGKGFTLTSEFPLKAQQWQSGGVQ